MGWMNDTLDYFRTDPLYRGRDYHKLTFSMMYYYDDNFLLPLSHDEVVHGKATILQKMNGQYEGKFPQARALYMYMYAHPGKKLNFMGNEIGQMREWDEKREQDWDILKYPIHDAFHRFMKDLNRLYLNNPALYERDYEKDGFQWLDCHQEQRCIYVMERRSTAQRLLAIFNFANQSWDSYTVKVPEAEQLTLLLRNDTDIYGGSVPLDQKNAVIEVRDGAVTMNLPPYFAGYYLIK
jgi:1,4-alpha-glucan branching enzyme